MVRELEKGGAKVLSEDDKLRHVEILFANDVEGSISAARDDHYVRPGTRPELRWSTIMEDLRRRDFSLNAIAISLNPASRGPAARSHQWTLGHRARRSARAHHPQLHESAGSVAACAAPCRAHGLSSWNRAPRNGSTWRLSANCSSPSRLKMPAKNCAASAEKNVRTWS